MLDDQTHSQNHRKYVGKPGKIGDAIRGFCTCRKVGQDQQTTANDNWNFSCVVKNYNKNCPENGPDHDYGAPPILTKTSEGKDIILAGQKSGYVYGMDPDDAGKILWQRKLGVGGALGGVHWDVSAYE